MNVSAKKRYINPLVNKKRLMDINKEINQDVQEFLNTSFDYYMQAK